jgi:hypothetical protein
MDVDQAPVLVQMELPVAGAETAPNVLGKSLCSYGLWGAGAKSVGKRA